MKYFRINPTAMRHYLILKAFVLFVLLPSCEQKTLQRFSADNPNIRYTGRIDFADPKEPLLLSSASLIEASFKGDSCKVFLKKLNPEGEPNYISIEVDGEYQGRIQLQNDTLKAINVPVVNPAESHQLKIYKATEAANNQVAFGGLLCEGLNALPPAPDKKIEFIGNSITCGMGNDLSNLPCDSGVWYGQHNAYWAYGHIAARALDAQFLLSSVSGIGVYRNWNSLSPVMPEVYKNLYLNTDSTKRYDFSSYTPDLVSICLGTNDMSLGDGEHERLPFDSAAFVSAYINFVKTVFSKYPDTQICLLTSPMVKGDQGHLLRRSLLAVQEAINTDYPDKKNVEVFVFPDDIEPHGCDYHPDIEDHKKMAELLTPFYKELMGW